MQEGLTKFPLRSGKRSTYIDEPWVTVLDEERAGGWFCGFEWSGTWEMDVECLPGAGVVILAVGSSGTTHDLAPGAGLESPAAFVGLFGGDWDDAFNACRRYVGSEILPPTPEDWPTALHVNLFHRGTHLVGARRRPG
jgi:hypothetical protein